MSNKKLKDFKIQVYLPKESIKTQYSPDGKYLQLSFKIDSNINVCNIRVNVCVNEQRDPNNVPQMLYTPNKDNYI